MALPILGKRREAQQAAETERIEELVEKAIQPAVARAQAASQARAASGATYNPSSPFNQTGGFGQSFTPLPRPDSTFDSMFGPGYPLHPDPLDELGQSGRSMPRRSQYLVAANLNLLDRETPWTALKWMASECDIIQHSIQLVQDALVGLEWSWGFSPMILDQIMEDTGETNTAKASLVAREKYGDELAKVQKFFEFPDTRMGFTFSQWLSEMIYNNLVYDGIAMYPQYSLGGDLISLSGIDPTTIKILRDNQGFPPRPPAPAYQQILYGFPRGEYMADAEADGEFQSDQMSYYIRRPRAESIYGYPVVEECMTIAATYLQRQAWMRAEYTNGVTPRIFMKTADTETWTPEQLAYYENIMNDRLTGQIQRRQMMFLLRPGMEPEQMKSLEETYKNDYDEFLVMQIGAKFGVPQSLLGIQTRSSIGGNMQKGQSDQSAQFATNALKNFLIDCINDMARRYLGVGPELTITCTGGGDDDDDLTRAQADASDVSAGIRTRNEIRAERGIPVIDEPEADQLGVSSAAGVTFLAGQLEAQAAGLEAAKTMAANGQVPGSQPNGGNGGTNSDGGLQSSPSGSGPNGNKGPRANGNGSSNGNVDGSKKPATPVDNSNAGRSGSKDTKNESPASKELATFAKFVRTRLAKGTGAWRDFTFSEVDADVGRLLNETASNGDFELVKEVLDVLKGREDTPSDVEATDRLKEYWVTGKGGQEIRWGVSGDFDRCRTLVAGKIPAHEIDGYCASRHHDATGAWPGHAPGESKKAIEDDVTELTDSLHDRIVDFYAPKIAKVMQDSISVADLDAAINAARNQDA